VYIVKLGLTVVFVALVSKISDNDIGPVEVRIVVDIILSQVVGGRGNVDGYTPFCAQYSSPQFSVPYSLCLMAPVVCGISTSVIPLICISTTSDLAIVDGLGHSTCSSLSDRKRPWVARNPMNDLEL
jgi:hypothetical protein